MWKKCQRREENSVKNGEEVSKEGALKGIRCSPQPNPTLREGA
jgi:hypothetical protein